MNVDEEENAPTQELKAFILAADDMDEGGTALPIVANGQGEKGRSEEHTCCQTSLKGTILFASMAFLLFTVYLFTTDSNHGLRPPRAQALLDITAEQEDEHTVSLLDNSILADSSENIDLSATKYKITGPLPFCQMQLSLFRTTVRDLICARNGSFGIIPPSQQSHIEFLHFPKTGGESLEGTLKITKNHLTWWERQNWYSMPRIKRGLAVTIIRNPFDRMYSWFKFCLHGYRNKVPGPTEHCLLAHQIIHSHTGLHNLTCVSQAFEMWLETLFINPKLYNPWLTQPQHDFLGGVDPLHVDYIIRFEHYAEDYELLAHALGRNESLQHDNGSSSGDNGRLNGHNRFNITYDEQVGELLKAPYRDVYTEAAKKIVQMHFALDLSTFNYTF